MASRLAVGIRVPDWLRPGPGTEGDEDEVRGRDVRSRLIRLLVDIPELGIFVATAVVFVAMSILAANFLTVDNLLSVAQQISFLGIVASGMTFLLIAGELDLSVGSMYGFLAVTLAVLTVNHGVNIWLACVMTILVGTALGAFNGTLTTRFRVPSFIVTLGMLGVLRGLALAISQGLPVGPVSDSTLNRISNGTVLGRIPAQVIWLAGVMIALSLVLARSRFGYHIYATGGNRRSAAAAGIKTRFVKLYAFMLTGSLVGLISVLSIGWLGSANPLTGEGFELQVIAAVVIGGTSLLGGAGSIFGTFLGAAVIGMLSNGLVLLGVDQYWDQFATGAIIVSAAMLNVAIRSAAISDS